MGLRSQDPSRYRVSVPGDAKWKMPYARRCQYRTAHSRGAGAVAACSLEARALFGRGVSRATAGARAADPKSRALEKDARRLNRGGFTVHGVHPAFLVSGARFSAVYRVSRSRVVGWSDAAAHNQKRPRLG